MSFIPTSFLTGCAFMVAVRIELFVLWPIENPFIYGLVALIWEEIPTLSWLSVEQDASESKSANGLYKLCQLQCALESIILLECYPQLNDP
jgi:hypothetical protein